MRETYRIIIPYSQMNKNDTKLPSIFIISFRLEKLFDMFASAQLHKISKMFDKNFEKCSQDFISIWPQANKYQTFIFSEPGRHCRTRQRWMGERFENSKSRTKASKGNTVKTRKPGDKALLLRLQMLWFMYRCFLHCNNYILYTFFYW